MYLPHAKSWILTLYLSVFLIAVGCDSHATDRGVVRGEVTLDGQLLEQGSIVFTPIDGTKGIVAGGNIKNGQYQLSEDKGPAVGRNHVAIRAVRKSGKMIQKPMSPQGKMIEEVVEAIPPRFNSATTLKVEIKPEANTLNFEVQSK
jgi:hypothetical protein